MSDIGGVLGLWIGFSILTIAEFIEVGMDMMVYMGSWIHRNNRDKSGRDDSATKTPVTSSQLRGSARWYIKSPRPAPNTGSKRH